jgi:hypothetical protein
MHIFVLKANYELRVSRKSHLATLGGMDPQVFLFICLLLTKTFSWVRSVNCDGAETGTTNGKRLDFV